jgi:hypothetical protein
MSYFFDTFVEYDFKEVIIIIYTYHLITLLNYKKYQF